MSFNPYEFAVLRDADIAEKTCQVSKKPCAEGPLSCYAMKIQIFFFFFFFF